VGLGEFERGEAAAAQERKLLSGGEECDGHDGWSGAIIISAKCEAIFLYRP
jgi:hypothetical protein